MEGVPRTGAGTDWAQPLRDLDRKDINKPELYGGDLHSYRMRRLSFLRFLRRHDVRRATLFEFIEVLKGKLVTAAHEDKCKSTIGFVDTAQTKDYFHAFLDTYAKDKVREIVNECGDHVAFDA